MCGRTHYTVIMQYCILAEDVPKNTNERMPKKKQTNKQKGGKKKPKVHSQAAQT